MLKREMEAAIKSLVANAPAATAASIPGWDAVAAMVAPPPPDPKAKREPKPLIVAVETVTPKPGQDWAEFKVLHIHNGSSGRYYRGKKLDGRVLTAVFTAAGFAADQTVALVKRLGL